MPTEPSSHHSRRDTLRIGAAVGLAAAAGAGLASVATAQTPVAEGSLSWTKPSVSLTIIERMLAAAQAKATELGAPVAIAVVDEGGQLKAFHRMDGVASPVPIDISQMKAYSAASFRTPTHKLAESNLDNPARMASLPNVPKVTLLAGGYPITEGDVVIGAIGVSGSTPDNDMAIAEAGLAAIQE
jgi:uncharacterized protein GlcG (DUF336 family)